MKSLKIFLLLSISSLVGCCGYQVLLKKKTTMNQRELLKDYFLCISITEGFSKKNISEDDISQSVYFDILRYSPEAFQEVQKYARSFIKTIDSSPIEDLGNKKAIILNSIEQYKSKELDDFIKQLDDYLLDDDILLR